MKITYQSFLAISVIMLCQWSTSGRGGPTGAGRSASSATTATKESLLTRLLDNIAYSFGPNIDYGLLMRHLNRLNLSQFEPRSGRVLRTALGPRRAGDFDSCSVQEIIEAIVIAQRLAESMQGLPAGASAGPTITSIECPDYSGDYVCRSIEAQASSNFSLAISFRTVFSDDNFVNEDPHFSPDALPGSDSDSDDDDESEGFEEHSAFDRVLEANTAPLPNVMARIEATFSSDRPEVALSFAGLSKFTVRFTPWKSCYQVNEGHATSNRSFISVRPTIIESGKRFTDSDPIYLQFIVDPNQPDSLRIGHINATVMKNYANGEISGLNRAGDAATCHRQPQRSADLSGAPHPASTAAASTAAAAAAAAASVTPILASTGRSGQVPPRMVHASEFDAAKLQVLTQKMELSHSHCRSLTVDQLIDHLLSWSTAKLSPDHRGIASNVLEALNDDAVKLIPICNRNSALVAVGALKQNFYVNSVVSSPFMVAKGAGRAVLLEVARRCALEPQCHYLELFPIDPARSFYFKVGLTYDLNEGQFFLNKENFLDAFPEFDQAIKTSP